MSLLQEMFPLLIPIFVLWSNPCCGRCPAYPLASTLSFGNRAMWLVLSLVVVMFGPIIYFVFGRGEEK